jgi:hypothetical protein
MPSPNLEPKGDQTPVESDSSDFDQIYDKVSKKFDEKIEKLNYEGWTVEFIATILTVIVVVMICVILLRSCDRDKKINDIIKDAQTRPSYQIKTGDTSIDVRPDTIKTSTLKFITKLPKAELKDLTNGGLRIDGKLALGKDDTKTIGVIKSINNISIDTVGEDPNDKDCATAKPNANGKKYCLSLELSFTITNDENAKNLQSNPKDKSATKEVNIDKRIFLVLKE